MASMFDSLMAKDPSKVAVVVGTLGVTVEPGETWDATKGEIAKRATAVLRSKHTTKPATLKRWHGVASMATAR